MSSSIRVRRGSVSNYTQLNDSPPGSQRRSTSPARRRSRTVASVFHPLETVPSVIAPPTPDQESPQSQPDSQDDPHNNDPDHHRHHYHYRHARLSRVSHYILSGKRRSRHRSSGAHSSSDGSHRDTLRVDNAPQMELLIPTHGQPGLMGSSLSLPRSIDESSDDSSEHHDDDIVDHLDVIDAEISAVSNLQNAANSILIPPLNFYDRRPVVMLPTTARVPARANILTDTEKGIKPEQSAESLDELDRHVDDVLRRRDKFKRTMKGFWTFVKTPTGAIAVIYGFLCAFWGAAIVFFLAKFINLHNADRQGFWVEVCSQVENGLFTVTGVGLIPWRVVDTYRMFKIWRFKRLTRSLRKKAGLPPLIDIDDLPDPIYDPNYVHVLTEKQQEELHYQQTMFKKSQTWYRPHGTSTHKAFPINRALLICLLIDGNSIFQCMLCGTMWGLNRFQRPAWTTGTLIPASFLCGIAAVVAIWVGGHKTKRTQEVEERLKAALAVEKRTRVPAGITIVTQPPPEDETNTTKGESSAPNTALESDIGETMTIPHHDSLGIPSEPTR